MPNFGNESVGGVFFDIRQNGVLASKFSCPDECDVTSMTAHLTITSASQQLVKLVIYADAAGTPAALLGVSQELTLLNSDTDGWRTANFTAPVRLTPGDYWLGIHAGTTGSNNDIKADSTSNGHVTASDTYSGGTANPFPTPSNETGILSIYATYQAADKTAPTGSFTTPASDYTVISGASYALVVDATDAGLGMAGVQFKDHLGANIGAEDTSATYTVNWNTTQYEDGDYRISAVLRDAANNTLTVYRWVSIRNRVDAADPEGAVRNPGAGATGGTIPIRIGAYDDVGIDSIELLIDGALTGDVKDSGLDNKCLNGHLEVSATGWAAKAGGTPTRTTSQAKWEAASLSVVCVANGDGAINAGALAAVYGRYYEVTVYVKGTSTEAVSAIIRRADGTTAVGSAQPLTLDGTWQKLNWQVQAPAGENLRLEITSTTGAQTFYVDGAGIYEMAEFEWQSAYGPDGTYTIQGRITDFSAAPNNKTDTAGVDLDITNVSYPWPNMVVEIDFDNPPSSEARTWTDVSDRFRFGEWTRGRDNELERFEAGEAVVRLWNGDRVLDPLNPASDYYGIPLEGKRLRLSAIYGYTTVRLHEGTIQDAPPEWTRGGTFGYLTLRSVDDLEPLAIGKISSPKATLTTTLTGTNNDLVFTSKYGGGNDISVEYLLPAETIGDTEVETETKTRWTAERSETDERRIAWLGGLLRTGRRTQVTGPPPTLEISSRKITVRLATSGGSIVTTAAQVKAAVEADPASAALVTVANAASNDGSGVVTVMAERFLTGGEQAAELSGARIEWVLDQLGVPTNRRSIDLGLHQVQAVEMDRQPGLAHAKDVQATELGALFCDGRGWVVFQDRSYRIDRAVKASFSTNPSVTGGEQLCLDVVPSSGLAKVRNDIAVSAPGMDTVTVADATSQGDFWLRSFDHPTLLVDTAELTDRADLLLAAYKDPNPEIRAMTLAPRRQAQADEDPASWPVALGLEISDLLTVTVFVAGGGSNTYESFVERILGQCDAEGEASEWRLQVGLSVALSTSQPPGDDDGDGGGGGGTPGDWRLDDEAKSILGTTTRLG